MSTTLPIINAFDGKQYHIGQAFSDPTVGTVQLLGLDDKFFSAKALVQFPDEQPRWISLVVRFAHPSHFLRRVAFIPT